MSKAAGFITTDEVLDRLPDWLRTYRLHRGLSLREAGEEIGISYTAIRKIERGEECRVYTARLILRWLIRQAS